MVRQRRNRLLLTASLVGAALVATALTAAFSAGGGSDDRARLVPPSGLPGELATPAPWARNVAHLRARLGALGLPALAQEGTALHTHQHLDVYVNGVHVPVPAGIGIAADGRFISPIHTHDESGIVHVESPVVREFTLGQLFAVWGVRLTPSCLGGYCADGAKHLRVYVDGALVLGDPRRTPLGQHDEIVVAFGTRAELPQPLPRSYEFPPGL